jgi:hypothetical protein
MPLASGGSQSIDHPYFVSLNDLDVLFAEPQTKLPGILNYYPRSEPESTKDKGKLLVSTYWDLGNPMVL